MSSNIPEVSNDTATVRKRETRPCAECFTAVEADVIEIAGRRIEFTVVCDECEAKLLRLDERQENEEKMARLKKEFNDLCPPLYQDTDLTRIYSGFARAATHWPYGAKGVTLIGPAGEGKTRAAWMLLKRIHMTGKKVYGLTGTQLGKFAADQWHSRAEEKRNAEEAIDRCRQCSLLLIDDLGKQKFTERAELELYDILEYRTSHLKPTVVTANSDGKELLNMLSEDRGEPILRRIQEFSTTIRIK
jgi:DNA replication protein DnaC